MIRLRREINITSGKLFPGIIRFAVPLFLTSLVQTLFTAVDTMVVGNFADSLAVAAIGAANPVVTLLIQCFVAIASGSSIIIARAIGARETVKIKKTVDTAMVFSAVFGVALMAAALAISTSVLKIMDCPEECFDSSVLYLKVYMLGTPAVMIYNFAAAIIRAEGDSTRPMVYVMISGMVNAVTNVILCLILPNKVLAVAIATVLSQVVSATMAMVRLMTKTTGPCRFSFRKITFSWRKLGEILRYGIPLTIATGIYPFANLQIQPAINSYGPDNIAGVTAAGSIDGILGSLQMAFASTCVTFMSQNIGAHQRKRVEKTFAICAGCGCLSGLVLGLTATYVFAEPLLGLYVPGNAKAIYYGQTYMQYVVAFKWLSALNGCISSAVQAFGYPTFATLNSLISVLGFRTVWMNFVYNRAPNIDMLYVCYTISWGITFVVGACLFVHALRKYRKKEATAHIMESI